LHWLGKAMGQHGASLYAYVLMTHHVHLLLSASVPQAIPRMIMSLGRRYVQYINRTCRRTGTLWDSRYKSSLVQAEGYFLSCLRYIELNPVRAAMVADPAVHRWSSYRYHAFGAPAPRLTAHPVHLALAANDPERQGAYRDLFRHALDRDAIADIRLCRPRSGPALGDSRFHDIVAPVVGHRRDPRPRGRPRKDRRPD